MQNGSAAKDGRNDDDSRFQDLSSGVEVAD
jgi:hypothetical protein